MAEIPSELPKATPDVGAPARLVLVALWTWANPRSARPFVWPSTESVAERCGLAARTVRTHLRALRAAGLIEAGEVDCRARVSRVGSKLGTQPGLWQWVWLAGALYRTALREIGVGT